MANEKDHNPLDDLPEYVRRTIKMTSAQGLVFIYDESESVSVFVNPCSCVGVRASEFDEDKPPFGICDHTQHGGNRHTITQIEVIKGDEGRLLWVEIRGR